MMENDLADYRKSYGKGALDEGTIASNPMKQFQDWFKEVEASKAIEEPNAMTLSTIGTDGYPKGRVVLLKKITEEGFIFFTNYHSEKGRSIAADAHVSLSFFWPALERQVIVKGIAEKIPAANSDDYFESRPKGSQLGAVVSNQSEVVASRSQLERALEVLKKEYADKKIERPSHWGGYRVRPSSLEFWQGRPNRLHDRIRYTQVTEMSWRIERLAP